MKPTTWQTGPIPEPNGLQVVSIEIETFLGGLVFQSFVSQQYHQWKWPEELKELTAIGTSSRNFNYQGPTGRWYIQDIALPQS
jgi:hypothetical protein